MTVTAYVLDEQGFVKQRIYGANRKDVEEQAALELAYTLDDPPTDRQGAPLFVYPRWTAETGWVEGKSLRLSLMRESIKAFIDEQASARLATFRSVDPIRNAEYDSKIAEARAYQTDSRAPTPLLDVEAAVLGMTKADLAAQVLARDAAWQTELRRVTALRRQAKIDIDSLESELGEELLARRDAFVVELNT